MVRRCCVMGCDGNYNEKKKKKEGIEKEEEQERKQKVFDCQEIKTRKSTG